MRTKLIIPFSLAFLVFIFYCCEYHNRKVHNNETISRLFMETWNTQDIDKLNQIFVEDCLYEEVGTGRSFSTQEAISKYIETTYAGAPDTKYEIVTIITDEEKAMVEWIWKGTNSVGWESLGIPPTGKYFELRGVSVLIIENNLIKRCSDYWDLNSFLTKIGVNKNAS